MHDYERHKAAQIITANCSADVIHKSPFNCWSLLNNGQRCRLPSARARFVTRGG